MDNEAIRRIAEEMARGLNGELEQLRKEVAELKRPNGATGENTGYEIIDQHWQETYEPVFKVPPDGFFSGKLGRIVRRKEMMDAPGLVLHEKLKKASNAPRVGKDTVNERAMRKFFHDEGSNVLKDWQAHLPVEEEAPVNLLAVEQFVDLIEMAMVRTIVIAESIDGPDRNSSGRVPQRKSIIHWAKDVAIIGKWTEVRSYRVWGRMQEHSPIPRVAVNAAVFDQSGRSIGMSHRTFTILCERYKLGRRLMHQRIAGAAAVELHPDFVEKLIVESEQFVLEPASEGMNGSEA